MDILPHFSKRLNRTINNQQHGRQADNKNKKKQQMLLLFVLYKLIVNLAAVATLYLSVIY
jgi:hypothetical protein